MWQCAFCKERNEATAEHCKQCGAHRPVDFTLEQAREIAPDIPVRIAGLRFWIFTPALAFFLLTGWNYNQYVKARKVVNTYRQDCANLSLSTQASACYGVPATYRFYYLSQPQDLQVVVVTPANQSPVKLTANPETLPETGSGTAVYWKGKLTELTTPLGQTETNESPVHAEQSRHAPIFCWFLLGFAALIIPFSRGFAFILEPDVDEDLQPNKRNQTL